LEPLHFEVLFCLAGMVTLTRRDGSALRLGTRQVLLLTDISDLTDTRVETGLKGVLVAVDARGARASLKAICDLLGGLTLNTDQVRRWMVSRGGCAVEGPSRWSQAAFADLDRLPQCERARWCVWKSVELLYLLSAQGEPAAEMAPVLDQEMIRTLAETRRYMEENLDEPLSISTLSRRACLSATTFKEGFRRLYGLPVHTWLQQRRMERAAELLRDSSLSVLGVAQSVGYSSASQFSAAFRRQYGMSPTMYRKMSEPA
jgi:AraC-like DNA-binding protein